MKHFLKTALMATATVLALGACSVDRGKLLNDLVGNWMSTEATDDGKEYEVARQFFASKDGETGNFIEDQKHYVDEADGNGVPYRLHYEVIVCGTYRMDASGNVSLQYDTATVALIPEEEDMVAYQTRVREWDAAQEASLYADMDDMELEDALLYDFEAERIEGKRSAFANRSDKEGQASIQGLKIEDGKLTFKASDGKALSWERIDDFFEEDFFDDDV